MCSCDCGAEVSLLDVGLVTDYKAFTDFGSIRITVDDQEQLVATMPNEAFSEPTKTIANFELPSPSAQAVTMTFIAPSGDVLEEKTRAFEFLGRRLEVSPFSDDAVMSPAVKMNFVRRMSAFR